MNRLLIPIVILLSSFLFSVLWWNPERKPYCSNITTVTEDVHHGDTLADSLAITEVPSEVDTSKLTAEEKVLFQPLDVYFNSGSSAIIRTQAINDWLNLAKKYLAENPNEKLSVTGHSDSDGSDELNMELSEGRAQKVKGILVNEGFDGDNLVVIAKGESEPIADNLTAEGKAKNRRVSIRLIK